MVTRRRERGQLVLIAAILVATAILGAVVLLNAVHSSPDVKAQTDAQSLSSAERTAGGIQQDLRQVFFAMSTGPGERQQPFAESHSVLADNTSVYSDELGRLLSTERTAVASVEYAPTSSREGSLVAAEEIPDLPPGNFYIEDATSLPYLNVTVAEDARVVIELYDSPSAASVPDREIELDGTDTTYETGAGSRTCEDVGPRSVGGADGVTVDLRRGGGEIHDGGGDVCGIGLDGLDQYYVRIDTVGGPVDGSFTVSGVDADPVPSLGPDIQTENNVVVDPAFEVSYRDPSITYDAELTLFGGDES